MPKDIHLQSAANYAGMGRSNERFIAGLNRQHVADVKARTEAWGKGIFEEASTVGIPEIKVLTHQAYFEISHQEFLDARERPGNFPWWQIHYVIGPLNSAEIWLDEKIDRVGIFSTFRQGAYLTLDFMKDDVNFKASSFRGKGWRMDVPVWRDLDAFDPGGDAVAYDLFVDKKPFERVELALEVLDWINDLVDLRKNPQVAQQAS